MSKDKKPEPLIPRYLLKEYGGRLDDKGNPVRLQHGALTHIGEGGKLRHWALATDHTLKDVLVPGYFDQTRGSNSVDLRAGDWILASCSLGEEVTEPALLYVERISNDFDDRALSRRPATYVEVNMLAGRSGPAPKKKEAA